MSEIMSACTVLAQTLMPEDIFQLMMQKTCHEVLPSYLTDTARDASLNNIQLNQKTLDLSLFCSFCLLTSKYTVYI